MVGNIPKPRTLYVCAPDYLDVVTPAYLTRAIFYGLGLRVNANADDGPLKNQRSLKIPFTPLSLRRQIRYQPFS